jgi:NAD(P)-dependent dehydrogenase (short-subunit alcohol dehydrogenase family)
MLIANERDCKWVKLKIACARLPGASGRTAEVRAQAANGGGLELVELDLASLESVRACADALVADGRPFDVVIANAGVMRTPFGRTVDGFETRLGTNLSAISCW